MNVFYILLANLVLSAYLTGLIWTIQIVHYPAFEFLSKKNFHSFHSFHSERITWIVAIPMLLELSLSIALLFFSSPHLPLWSSYMLLSFCLMAWYLTFFLAIPVHNQLSQDFQTSHIKRLLQINWGRTAAWSLRMLLIFYLLLVYPI